MQLGLLLLAGTLAAITPVRGAERDKTADVQGWEKLQAQKKDFDRRSPPSLEGAEFAKFLEEYSRRAGELADAFKAFNEKNPDNKEGREAWRQWMNHLDLAAQGIPERKVELEQTEQRLLADRNLSPNQRESIRWNQVDRIRDLGERERFLRSVQSEFRDPSFAAHHLLVIANFTDPQHARALVDEVFQRNVTVARNAIGLVTPKSCNWSAHVKRGRMSAPKLSNCAISSIALESHWI